MTENHICGVAYEGEREHCREALVDKETSYKPGGCAEEDDAPIRGVLDCYLTGQRSKRSEQEVGGGHCHWWQERTRKTARSDEGWMPKASDALGGDGSREERVKPVADTARDATCPAAKCLAAK